MLFFLCHFLLSCSSSFLRIFPNLLCRFDLRSFGSIKEERKSIILRTTAMCAYVSACMCVCVCSYLLIIAPRALKKFQLTTQGHELQDGKWILAKRQVRKKKKKTKTTKRQEGGDERLLKNDSGERGGGGGKIKQTKKNILSCGVIHSKRYTNNL